MKHRLKVPAGAVAPARAVRERPMQQRLLAGMPRLLAAMVGRPCGLYRSLVGNRCSGRIRLPA